jgi:hypothetical protein
MYVVSPRMRVSDGEYVKKRLPGVLAHVHSVCANRHARPQPVHPVCATADAGQGYPADSDARAAGAHWTCVSQVPLWDVEPAARAVTAAALHRARGGVMYPTGYPVGRMSKQFQGDVAAILFYSAAVTTNIAAIGQALAARCDHSAP